MIKNLLFVLFLCISSICFADNDDLVGRYYLTNKMEVGSELIIKKDKTFQWYISYGNQDLTANGSWSVHGKTIELKTPERPKLSGSPAFTILSDEDINLIRSASSNNWQIFVAVKKVGGVPDIDVILESTSHQQHKSTTDQAGTAYIYLPEGEKLSRVGLRWSGDPADYKWFNIPEMQAKRKISAFWVEDPKWALKQAFEKMEFEIKDHYLVSTQDNMIYKKDAK